MPNPFMRQPYRRNRPGVRGMTVDELAYGEPPPLPPPPEVDMSGIMDREYFPIPADLAMQMQIGPDRVGAVDELMINPRYRRNRGMFGTGIPLGRR